MSPLATTTTTTDRAVLAELLARSAAGDTDAFLGFYDATSCYVFTLEVIRARMHGAGGALARSTAARATGAIFVHAWRHAAEHASSELSALAWLLTLSVPTDQAIRATDQSEVACA